MIILAGSSVSYSVWRSSDSIDRVSQQLIDSQLPALYQLSDLQHQVTEYERLLYEFYATFDRPVLNPKIDAAKSKITSLLNELTIHFEHSSQLTKVAQSLAIVNQQQVLLDQVLPPKGNDWDAARGSLVEISRQGRNVTPALTALRVSIDNQLTQTKVETQRSLTQMSFWVFSFSLLMLILAIIVGYYMYTNVRQALENKRLAKFIENNPNPVACIDSSGLFEFENNAWRNAFDKAASEQLIELALADMQSAANQAHFKVVQCNLNNKIYELSVQQLNQLNQLMLYVENISEREQARKELEFLAFFDPLTQLPNIKQLQRDLAQLEPSNVDVFLVAVGAKQLASIATTMGMNTSDNIKAVLGNRIVSTLKSVDLACESKSLYRIADEQFAVLIVQQTSAGLTRENIERFFKQLRDCCKQPVSIEQGQYFIDLQAGCAIYPEHADSFTHLIKNASAALKEAQLKGSRRVGFFNLQQQEREQAWLKMENELTKADYNREFYLTYQPKVDVRDGKVVGMEALIRWQHPKQGLISPQDFIPVAERSGAINALGDWVMNKAMSFAREVALSGSDNCQVAVNVSPTQLLTDGFLERVMNALKRHHLAPRLLEIEITEEVLVEDASRCLEVIEGLQKNGVSVAIDDFGTGYSSLAYLNLLPISKIKIDRAFITDIDSNPNNYAIVNAIIAMSKKLDLKVVAEGIETQQELAVLKELNCDQAQGYFFSKPLTEKQFSEKYLGSSHGN
ncbi:putative bifunctional diguanylate cyclase/phosphodiesterase [Aliikangiella sp. IMCC44653]